VISAGSMFGALLTARLRRVKYKWVATNVILMAFANIGMAWSPNVWIAFLWAFPLGGGGAAMIAATNSIIQNEAPPDMRGRMLALTAVAYLGSTPIGGPITGWIADAVSVRLSLGYGGIIGALSGISMSVWIWRSGVDRK